MSQLGFFGLRKNLGFYCEEVVHEWLRGNKAQINILEH